MNEINGKQPSSPHRRPMRAKLIFNPSAGATRGSPVALVDVVREMLAWKLVPEAFLVEEGCDLPGMVRAALAQGIRLFVVCGGDGTISAVGGILAGMPASRATLGIIPIGTQNNMALSLGIPAEMPAAVALLRTGRRVKVDVGMATYQASSANGGEISTPFLEVCSVGLISTLFPSVDDVQHGNLARVGDFLATFVGSAPAEIHLVLDDKQEVRDLGHVVLVANMPYIGRHYKIDDNASFHDGLLDVLFFADLSKMELLGYIFNGVGPGKTEDPRIQHYHARRVEIDTQPAMPIMADGKALGEGRVQIEVQRRVLTVMAGKQTPATLPDPSTIVEAQTHAATE